jgi:hypothetical protein
VQVKAIITDSSNTVNNIIWELMLPIDQSFNSNSVFISSRVNTSSITLKISELTDFNNPYQLIIFVSNAKTTISNSATFYINNPPKEGNFTFIPLEGKPLLTEFDVNITGWEDYEGEEMTFELYYLHPTMNKMMLL